jgi:hypothetical protein
MEALSERAEGKFEKYGSTSAMEVATEENDKMAKPAMIGNFAITRTFASQGT